MGAQDYMVGNAPGGASYQMGNMAQQLFQMLSGLPEQYRKGQDFRYKQRQQDLFQGGVPTDANGQLDYGAMRDKMLQSGGAPAVGQIGPLLGADAQRQFYQNLPGGGAQPSTGPNTSPVAQSADALQRASERAGGGQPSLSSAGMDSAGGENIQTLSVGIANAKGIADVSPAQMQSFARVLGVDLDTPLSADQEKLARKLIGTNLRRAGSTQATPLTNDPASGGYERGPIIGGQGGQPISPAPTSGGGGIAPSGPRADGDSFSSRFNPGAGEPATSRGTPIGTLQDAQRADEMARRYLTLSAAPMISPQQAAAAKAMGEQLAAKAKQIREGLVEYGNPKNNPEIQGQLHRFEGAGKAVGDEIGEYRKAMRPMRQMVNQLDIIDDAVKSAGNNLSTGPGADAVLKMKQFLANVGFDAKGLPQSEVIVKMNAYLASEAAKQMTNRPSQMEFKAFMANNPGIMNSVAGTRVLTDILRQTAKQTIDLGRLAGDESNWSRWGSVEDTYFSDPKHAIRLPFSGNPAGGLTGDMPLPKGVRSIQVVQ